MKFDKYETKGAYHFGWYDDPNFAWYKECVDRIVDFCKGSTLDVGGGDGLVAKKLQELGYMTMVLDNDQTAAELCWSAGINFHLSDINKDSLARAEVRFDYLCCLNTIEHLKSTDGITNLIRDNINNGAIIITDKATEHKGRYHEHEYTKEELLDTFKEFKPKYFEINSTEFGKPITFIGVEIIK